MNTERSCDKTLAGAWAVGSLKDPLALSLSKEISRVFDPTTASYSVFADKTLPEMNLMDFEHGGKVNGQPSTDHLLKEFLSSVKTPSFLVVEDWTARPHDPFLKSFDMPAYFKADEVYYVVRSDEAGVHPKWGRICANQSPLFHAFLFDGEFEAVDTAKFDSRLVLSKHGLLALILGIYDGESYMLAKLTPVS